MHRQILGEGMSDLRQKPKKIKYNGTEYEILFTIEVMDKIEDTMGLTSNDVIEILKNPRKDRETRNKFLRLGETLINIDAEKKNLPRVTDGELANVLTNASMLDLLKVVVDTAQESFFVRQDDDDEEGDPNQNRATQ